MAAEIKKVSPKKPATSTKEEEKPVIAGYEVIRRVGRGAYGIVWEVREKGNDRRLAAKIIQRDVIPLSGIDAGDVNEISLQRYIEHPNIVPILAVVQLPLTGKKQALALIMPFLGRTLSRAVSEQVDNGKYLLGGSDTAQRVQQRIGWAHGLLCGLRYLHAHQFLHLDFKPQNVLMDEKDDVVIADFGLAQLASSRRRWRTPNSLVTSWYRAPELFCGDYRYTEAADYWSYALVLFHIFFGRDAFPLDEVNILRAIRDRVGWPEEFEKLLSESTVESSERELCAARTEGKSKPQKSIREMAESLLGLTADGTFRKYYESVGAGLYDRIWGLIGAGLQVVPSKRMPAIQIAATALFRPGWNFRCKKPLIHSVRIARAASRKLKSMYTELQNQFDLSEETIQLAIHLIERLIASGIHTASVRARFDHVPSPLQRLVILELAAKHTGEADILPVFVKMLNQGELDSKWSSLSLETFDDDVTNLENEYLAVLGNTAWPEFFFSEVPLREREDEKLNAAYNYLQLTTRFLAARFLRGIERALEGDLGAEVREHARLLLADAAAADAKGKRLLSIAAHASAARRLGDADVLSRLTKSDRENPMVGLAIAGIDTFLDDHPEATVAPVSKKELKEESKLAASSSSSTPPSAGMRNRYRVSKKPLTGTVRRSRRLRGLPPRFE